MDDLLDAGSQQFHLMRDVAESPAGRVGIMHLLGLSRRERDGLADGHGPFLPTPDFMGQHLADATALPLPDLHRRIGPGGVICLAESSLPLADGIVTIPVGAV